LSKNGTVKQLNHARFSCDKRYAREDRADSLSYVDAHLHLADSMYSGRIESILRDASSNEVARLLSNSMDYGSSIQTIALAKQHEPMVLAAVGVHPWTIVNSPNLDLDKFDRLLDDNRDSVKAIGEIGLDGKYTQDKGTRLRQREIFQFFLRAAEKRQLPVVVHSRLAVDDVLDDLSGFSPPMVLLHWYDGPVEKLGVIKERGYMISVGPSVFYSKRIKEIVKEAGLNMLLSETDGPVAHYGPFAGKPTQPSFVIDVVRQMAEIRSDAFETIREAVWNNFRKLIRL
jgi:TatD DNase family protein